ncbi:hypothetical protein J2794_000565 [Paraburkholderia terricola]|uniref:DUF3348 domain-containing protein n=1 Tax=Paraburkholderia terricola TaxID=169427 RepID=UPI0028571D79|nr:DUF3348 domain-containing protein [Paraburkholderia terricola]MDR6444476.1 hypothetical protein [Paraburkholderia terricola]
MLQIPQRTVFSGPALIRLLARLTDADVPESRQSLSDRLSQWLGWTDAIALSSALNGNPPAVASGARPFGSADEEECARVRSSLTKAIAGDSVLATAKRRAPAPASAPSAATDTAVDYAVFRQRYLSLQQTMETGIGTLRGRLRGMLAARTPAIARLALVDAVMERALAERERGVLGAVPGLLAGHFERLRVAEQAALAGAEAGANANAPALTSAHIPGAWLDVFRKDMQSVLLAELDVRFQPVEGLLAALRAS